MAPKHRNHPRLPLQGIVVAGLLGGFAAGCGPRNGTDDVTPAQDTAAAAIDRADTLRTDTLRTDTLPPDTLRTDTTRIGR
jgi:hypothetical protein